MTKLKAIILTIAIATLSQQLWAQAMQTTKTSVYCPKFYLGTSTGLENPTGLLGVSIDVPLNQQFSLGGGAGLSSWGYKVAGEGRFYFGECHRGWAIGAGATYNTGLNKFPVDVTVISGTTSTTQKITMELKPCFNAFISAYHFWQLGNNGHRFYLQGGYSYRITKDAYTFNNPSLQITSTSARFMDVLAPGGVMVALGFSFALSR